ncbi:hypothetical protein TWF506_008073 [Arthrobotrys conoides]|uniref:Uncharacterized protein n=1 Tax=Arthrobotrys conoides TaxID=74498 RepID=A0AAN8RMD7_9PEZI
MSNDRNRGFSPSHLNAGAPPWGVDTEPEGGPSGRPGQTLAAPTPDLPTSIYPFPEENKDNLDPFDPRKYNNRRITNRPVFQSSLSTLVEESAPDDGPAAFSANTATPNIAMTPRVASASPSVPPRPTSGPFAQTPIGPTDSNSINRYNSGADPKYAQPNWSGPTGSLAIPFMGSTPGFKQNMPNFGQRGHDTNPSQQIPLPTVPLPVMPPRTPDSYLNEHLSKWPLPDQPFPAQPFGNQFGSSVGGRGGGPMNEASMDGALQNDISMNSPVTDGSTANSNMPNQYTVGGAFLSRQNTARSAEGGQGTSISVQDQEIKNELLGELRKNYALDPMSMIEKGFLPTLEENNFPEWAINIERYLKGEGLWPDWKHAEKYEGCSNPELHVRSGRGRYSCTRPECVRRDRIDAAGLLVMVMSCDKNNRSLVLRQTAVETAWLFLERAHVGGIREMSPDFRLLHPTGVMANAKAAPVDDHKISDFLMTAYKQWCFYLWLVDNHGSRAALPPSYVSENDFLGGVFSCFPDHPPYKPVKDFWLERIRGGGQEFIHAYGWVLGLERGEMETLRTCFGMHWLPGSK